LVNASHNGAVRVAVDDVRLYFDVEGCRLVAQGGAMMQRPTLVLLHGGPGVDHSFFKPEFSAMADAAQVIYLDQRGSGRSDRGDPSGWTWSRWADDVAGFCRALEIESPLLVGTSSGGRVAVECAARHPSLVSGLALDSTLFESGLDESLEVFGRRGGPAAREAAARFLGGDRSPEALAAWKAHAMPLYGSASDGDMAARGARAMVNREVQARFSRGECGPLKVTAEDLDRVTCPVLILTGEDDPMSPAAAAQRVASSVHQAAVEIQVFAAVGHGVFRQAPAEAFARLRAFVSTVSDSGG
jgi:pimeloyl-ACP methyl ester carboxylesterase